MSFVFIGTDNTLYTKTQLSDEPKKIEDGGNIFKFYNYKILLFSQ